MSDEPRDETHVWTEEDLERAAELAEVHHVGGLAAFGTTAGMTAAELGWIEPDD